MSRPADRAGTLKSIHIVVVVYGQVYTELLANVILFNLAGLVTEIPRELRLNSRLRILTTEADKLVIESSPAMSRLRAELPVEVLPRAVVDGFAKHGAYGPMVETQRLAVVEAANENAALFFVGPDQIYSRGAFKFSIDRLREGYRVLIGPGLRVKRDEVRQTLAALTRASGDQVFALSPEQQIELLFRHYHPINDQFTIGSDQGIQWKAYVYHRPRPDELLIRFFQGPTLVAWPRMSCEGFRKYVDHDLIKFCCSSPREVYVVQDANECLALDLTADDRTDYQPAAMFPRAALQQELFNHAELQPLQLEYGRRTCHVHRAPRDELAFACWTRELSQAIDPHIFLALAERRIHERFGATAARFVRFAIMANVHTLALILPRFLRRYWRSELGRNGERYAPGSAG